jgi:hypothetical protein
MTEGSLAGTPETTPDHRKVRVIGVAMARVMRLLCD